jgi:hypothetical protein
MSSFTPSVPREYDEKIVSHSDEFQHLNMLTHNETKFGSHRLEAAVLKAVAKVTTPSPPGIKNLSFSP